MNKGLKNYTKHLTHTVGSATADFNLFERDANMHITIPLLSTKGLNPFGTNLIFNYQDKNVFNDMFGYGFKLDHYAKITATLTTVTVENADGSEDTYEFDQWNPETQMKVSKVYSGEYNDSPNYEFEDRDGNKIIYESLGEYPSRIQMKSGDSINFGFIGSAKTISNGKGDIITFVPNTEGKIGSVKYTYNGAVLERIDLVYEADRLSMVIYQTPDYVCKAKMQIKYSDNQIIVFDAKTNHRKVFRFVNNLLVGIDEGYGPNLQGKHSGSVEYENNCTTVFMWDQSYVEYYFDSDGMPLYQVNNKGYAMTTRYDRITKMLVEKSNPFLLKGSQKNYFASQSMDSFSLSNVTRETVTFDDSKWNYYLGNPIYKFSHSGSETGTIIFEVPIDCVATDNVMAVLWARQNNNYSTNSYVHINMQVGEDRIVKLSKPEADDNFELILLGANCKHTESSIRFVITLAGDVSFDLGGIQIVRQDFGSFFTYDENGKISLLERAGEVAKRSYNAENQLSTSTEFDTTINTYEYNSKGYPTKATSAHGIEISNEYHASYPSLLTKQTLTDKEANKTIEVTKEYSSDGRHVTKEYDELGTCVSSITYENDKPDIITNANGVITTFDYEHDLVMSMLLENDTSELSKATYTYYEDSRRLKTVTLKNGSVYEFIYDFRGNVSTIKLNGTTIFSYYYEESTGNLLRIHYGPTNEHYKFRYTYDNLVKNVYFVTSDGVELHRFYYEYDDKTKLLQYIQNGYGDVIASFEYDAEGKLIKTIQQENYVLEYAYDNLGNINSLLRKVRNKIVHESYVNATRSQSSHPDVMVKNFSVDNYFTLFDGNANLKKNGTTLAPIGNNFSFGKEGLLPYIEMSSAKPLAYNLPEHTADSYENGCVQFWFKPNEVGRIQYLFGIQGSTGHYLTVYCEEEQLHVEVKERNKAARRILYSTNRVIQDKWNFFALDFYFRSDDGAAGNGEIILRLNNKTEVFTMSGTLLNMDLTYTQRYYIGRRYDGASNEVFTGKIACLSIAPRTYCSLAGIETYYNVTKDFINDCRYIDSYEETVDISETVAFMPSATSYNAFEIFPLNNDLLSIKGMRPVKYTQRRGVVEDKDKSFNFNPISKRYAYVADGAELVYSFGQSNSGTILMRAYTDHSNDAQYLFEGKDANGKTISLRRDGSNYLRVDCDQYENRSTLLMSNNEWHTVGLSFEKLVTGDSDAEEISGKVRIFLDGQVQEFEVPVDFSNLEFAIGRRYDVESVFHYMGRSKECYPFYGQIEMLCANSGYANTSTLNNLMAQIKPITKTNEFDDFGRVKHSCLINGDEKLLEKTLGYSNRPNNNRYTSERVSSESFEIFKNGSSNGFSRVYTYDNLGNVTAISDNTNGSHTYEYDDRGFLVRDDNTTYAYDGNGNITQRGSSVLIYDSVIKDKLVEVGGEPIEYSEIDPLLPTAFDGYHYAYEGKRLVSFTDAIQHEDYTYEYNDQGQRIMKSTPNELIEYVYSGNKLIAEECPYYDLNFLYDENDQLYGFIKDGSLKYFYLRDSLQNILGIIDSTGNLVVKYDYTAYGGCTITLDTNGIGALNPFRYKGYYYDSESGMYYCNSRYYVPEWCRWLTPDSPSFLQPESLNGMNFFAYCGNDPVNKLDSSGCFAILAALKRINNAINGVKTLGKWLYNHIGVAHIISSTIASEVPSSIYGRTVIGAELDATINKGDFNKPITFFSQESTNPGYLSEFEAGVSVNIGNGGIEHSLSLNGGFNLAIDFGGTAFEFSVGPAECGIKYSTGTDFKNKTAKSYSAFYFRPIAFAPVLIGMIAGTYYPTGVVVPAY